jgi:hypothetical protein
VAGPANPSTATACRFGDCCGQLATEFLFSLFVCLKNKRKDFIAESRPYNRAVSIPEGNGAIHAILRLFLLQFIRASYKSPRENVFVSIRAFMHIGLLLI